MKKSFPLALLPIAIITALVGLLYYFNFRGPFTLTGWDNLHPEYNYWINIKRAFFSAWQEYQGVGLPAGNAHATELIREILLWISSLFIPRTFIRSFYMLVMLFLGPVGVYILCYHILLRKLTYSTRILASMCGSVFYLINIGTVQIFYVPFEAFAAQYGMIPWMIWSILYYTQRQSKKALLLLFIIQLAGSVQFFIPTIFVVYIFVAFFIIVSTFDNNRKLDSIKSITLILSIIVIVNLYWLFPFLFYLTSNISSQLQSFLNILYSDDIYQMNVKYGTFLDVVQLKGFLFDYIASNSQGKNIYMMESWRQFVNLPIFIPISVGLFSIVCLGLISQINKRTYIVFSFLFLILFSLLAIREFPFSLLNDLLRRSNLFNQVFRNPFTKFANAFIFIESILFAFGIALILERIEVSVKQKWRYVGKIGVTFTCFVALNILFIPAWKGNFIYRQMKVSLPSEYKELFSFFESMPNGRIANFPQFSYNSWGTYQWGYMGSGFLWYGIEQPIMDRSFDVWHASNENYYWEMSQALYSFDISHFEAVVNKYNIDWIVFDENVTTGKVKSLYIDKIQRLISSSALVSLSKTFGRLKIYRVTHQTPTQNFVSLIHNPPLVTPVYQWNNNDRGYRDIGNYLSDQGLSTTPSLEIYYPFRSIFTNRGGQFTPITLIDGGNYTALKAFVPQRFLNSNFIIPSLSESDIQDIQEDKNSSIITKVPRIVIDDLQIPSDNSTTSGTLVALNSTHENPILEVQIPKMNGIYSAIIHPQDINLSGPPIDCNAFTNGFMARSLVNSKIQMRSISSSNCIQYEFPNLTHRNAYLLTIESKFLKGKPLHISLYNKSSEREELETYVAPFEKGGISSFIIAPKEKYGLGYSLNISNISMGMSEVINEIGDVSIRPIPYDYLTKLSFQKKDLNRSIEKVIPQISITHSEPNTYGINISGPIQENTFLRLSQSYHHAWHAYSLENDVWKAIPFGLYLTPFLGKKIENHILLNNWENAWEIQATNNSETFISLVYWPQYLEYLGFVLLGTTFVGILFWKERKTRSLP